VKQADVPLPLRTLQWVDLTTNYERGVRELIKVMHGVSDKPDIGEPPDYVKRLQKSVGGLSKEASAVGVLLLQRPEDSTGFERAYGAKELHEMLPFFSVAEFNDAVDELESFGLVEVIKTFGTAPYDFNELTPTYALFLHFKDAGLGYDPLDDVQAVAAAVAARDELDGPALQELTKLSPVRLNRAVSYLDAYGNVNVVRVMGTAPYDFDTLAATRRTREFVKQYSR
jgi:hypothetical protein